MNVDQLVNALTNQKVIAVLSKVFDDVLSKRLCHLEETVIKLNADLCDRMKEIQKLESDNALLKTEMFSKSKKIEDLERYSRQDDLIIHGISESFASIVSESSQMQADIVQPSNELSAESENAFLRFCSDQLGVKLSSADISTCHRLKGKRTGTDSTRPLIDRFTSRKAKIAVLAARKKLAAQRDSSPKVYINEHLTPTAVKLFAEARRLKKQHQINDTWTRNGLIYVKELNNNIHVFNGSL